jgi:penicillin amidase
MNKKSLKSVVKLALIFLLPLGHSFVQSQTASKPIQLKNLRNSVRIVRDSQYVPHIFARNDHDLFFMLGNIHAKDRFFQMDMQRRLFSGQLAELFGVLALSSDTSFRTYGLRRSAEVSLDTYSEDSRMLLRAYAEGVNHYLAEIKKNPELLPVEYPALELSAASIPDWSPVDTLTLAKGLAYQFSFDLRDISLTTILAVYEEKGRAGGFDGNKLFYEDLFRIEPFDSGVSIAPSESSKFMTNRDASKDSGVRSRQQQSQTRARRIEPRSRIAGLQTGSSELRKQQLETSPGSNEVDPVTAGLARKYLATIEQIPSLQNFVSGEGRLAGSNWWVLSGRHTVSGFPMLANDPHLLLDLAPVFYEVHLNVEKAPGIAPMNVNGMTMAGIPAVLTGCNERICWGASVNPMDETDIYREQLVEDSKTVYGSTLFEGKAEPLIVIEQKYKVNKLGDKTLDSSQLAQVKPAEGGLTWIVPRRNNGPILEIEKQGDTSYGLSLQYTGTRATRELETFWRWARGRSLEDFKRGLQDYEIGSQNWAVTDIAGNIAYFTSGKVPLREDLQNLGRADGNTPPFLIRDGTHKLRHEWLPMTNSRDGKAIGFQTLPFSEMPQVINPKQGYIINANNDPVGATFDNQPLNQFRKGGGVYYLNRAYYTGLRMGRIRQLLEDGISKKKKFSLQDMMRFQADHHLFDAEILIPHIIKAFENARAPGATPVLAALAATPSVAEAVERLRRWDYTTPTGIQEGYDPGDDPAKLPTPSASEIQSSVGATIYAVWRSQLVDNVIDKTLRRLELANNRPGNSTLMTILKYLLDDFKTHKGRGASGVNFFEVKDVASPETARDIIILTSLQESLTLLASKAFAPAFKNSTNQDDYRWGRLHRVVFKHRLAGRFSIPGGNHFSDLASDLPGLARPGGFESMDGSVHPIRVTSVSAFVHRGGAAARFVGEMTNAGPKAFQIIPGGQSGDVRSPFYANMIGHWLTNQYHPMLLTSKQVQADSASEQRFEPVH